MKLLVIGHSLIIDSNRKFWGKFAQENNAHVDLVVPREWSSNLSHRIDFTENVNTDAFLRKISAIKVFFKGNGSFFFFNPFGLISILSKEKYDAIYLNQETWSVSTALFLLGKLVTKNKSTKVFLCVAQNIKKEKLKFLHPYERLVSRAIHAFLHCSQEVEDVLRWKGINKPSLYFPLPYDDEVYQTEVNGHPLFTLGFLGRLSEEKGLRVLLKALDELNQHEILYPLIVGGNGPLVQELKARSYVHYLGLIPHNMAHEFYKRIDCFILPSQTFPHWKEQFGRVIIEAFATGRPVIGSSSGSIPEVLSKLEWPWIFKEDSADELKMMIIKLKAHLTSIEGQKKLAYSVELNKKLFSQSKVALTLYQQMREAL